MPIIQRLTDAYKLWHECFQNFPQKSRYTLGAKIDNLFLEVLELTFLASYLNHEQKLPFLRKAGAKLDSLKFFIQLSWEIKIFDNKKYLALSEQLTETGRMLGGWIKQTEKINPAKSRE